MSSFDALESSSESSRPIEVYRFAFGASEFRYTSSSADVTLDSLLYASTAIRRNNIVVGQTERKRVLEIEVPHNNLFASRYRGVPPGQKATLDVTRIQRDEPGFANPRRMFRGKVLNVRFPGEGKAVISAQTFEGAVGRTVPRRSYMGMCNHTLYGPGCNVDPNSYKFTGNVSAVSGNVITVDGAGASGFDFTGGYVRPTLFSDPRLVLAQSGDDLTLMIPFETSAVGSTADCYAGCDHNINGDCAQVFDNVIQYGGFAFVPTRNIVTKGLL